MPRKTPTEIDKLLSENTERMRKIREAAEALKEARSQPEGSQPERIVTVVPRSPLPFGKS